MRDSTRVIDAPGLVTRGMPATEDQEMMTMRKPSGLVEAAARVLGTMLVFYRHYVPNSEYYKFTTQSFSRQRWYDGDPSAMQAPGK